MLVTARNQLGDPVIDPVGQAAEQTLVFDRRQFDDLYRIARPAQQTAIGDLLAVDVEQPRAGAGRLDQPAHHLACQIRQQDLALIGRIQDRALAQRRGEDLALGVQ